MEIDRIDGRPKGKSGNKGKSKDSKGQSKGKQKGKSKGKQDFKGKGKGGDQKGGKGSSGGERSKGKGKSDKQCHTCGRYGHFARDCWQNQQQVRAVNQGSEVPTSNAGAAYSTVQGSPSSSTGGSFTQVTSVSQQAPQNPQHGAQNAQYRVARIVEDAHDDLVFDLTGGREVSGFVRVVHFHIGDEDECSADACVMSGIRAIVEEVSDDAALETTLLDSGADASVFPLSLINAGVPIDSGNTRLCDAQGKSIPIESMRLVEIKLPTSTGQTVTLKERVAVSSKVSQPILCFGHLLEQGFGIDGVEQALVHKGSRVNVPLQLQNKSMTVLGHIRVLQTTPDHDNMLMVRAVRADVEDGLINSPIGWSVNESGYIIGRHLSDSFQDPSLAFPALQGPQCRTTLVKGDDNLWYILELNEPLRAIIQMDSKFYDMEGMRSTITIVTEGEKAVLDGISL